MNYIHFMQISQAFCDALRLVPRPQVRTLSFEDKDNQIYNTIAMTDALGFSIMYLIIVPLDIHCETSAGYSPCITNPSNGRTLG